MPPELVRFTIPWVPPVLNPALRTHWRGRGRTLKTAAGFILAAAGRKVPPEDRPVSVRIHMVRRGQPDHDGAVGGSKPVFDALVRLGWARDDSPAWMHQEVLVTTDRRARPRTEIEIERLSSPASEEIKDFLGRGIKAQRAVDRILARTISTRPKKEGGGSFERSEATRERTGEGSGT